MKKIRILLADDHTVVREGLRAVLSMHEDLEIVGEAQDGREAVRLTSQLMPDVVVMDVAMPQLNGLDATRQILRCAPSTKVLVLTSYNDDECIAQLMQAGAVGYLLKHTAANELPQAVREVRRGNTCVSPALAKHLHRLSHSNARERACLKSAELTARERKVLELVASGYSNKEAAAALDISIKTIEKHRQQVMNKLNIHEAAGLTRYAISRGVVPLRPNVNSSANEQTVSQAEAEREVVGERV